jgi:phosphocarrier protein
MEWWNYGIMGYQKMASFLKFIIEQDFAYAQYLDIPKPRFPIFLYSKVPFSGKALELNFMWNSESTLSREVTIINELGLHARSAAKIAKLAQPAAGSIWIVKGDQKADASSILDILTLACEKGTRITICVENKADCQILEDLTKLVESGFGE